MSFIDLNDFGLEFKHIVSGPAPVGRILNYVVAVGDGILEHKNGERTLQLFNYKTKGVGSAWCTEFMVGLGLVIYDTKAKGRTPLFLTESGRQLYELIKHHNGTFNEDKSSNKCKNQLMSFSIEGYNLFKDIFLKSVVCKNLVAYIQSKKKATFSSSDFKEEYYSFFYLYYEKKKYVANSKTATTAENRVPSLIELCVFFDLVIVESGEFKFNFDNLQTPEIMGHYVRKEILEKQAQAEERKIRKIENLVERFGESGEIIRETLTRNSTVQQVFRNNLIAKYGCQCAICKKDIEEVLVASHIKPSSESNVEEKIDDNNGLLLCANHDKLFDRCLISFNYKTGLLMHAVKLSGKLEQYDLNEQYELESVYLSPERSPYLHLHNLKFNEKNAII